MTTSYHQKYKHTKQRHNNSNELFVYKYTKRHRVSKVKSNDFIFDSLNKMSILSDSFFFLYRGKIRLTRFIGALFLTLNKQMNKILQISEDKFVTYMHSTKASLYMCSFFKCKQDIRLFINFITTLRQNSKQFTPRKG